MSEPALITAQGSPPTPEAIRAELNAVLNSAAFRRSERHSRFLRFVCEKTLEGESSKLNEYLIAHAVFERGEDYSPGDDSVVRRQAYTLRQKLQDYYSTEGVNDPLRIELPTGRYVPNFLNTATQNPAAPVEEQAVMPVETRPRETRHRTWLLGGIAAAVAATAFGLGWMLHTPSKKASADPAMVEVWGPWLTDPQGAYICFSNPLTTTIRQVPTPYLDDSFPIGVKLTEPQAQEFRKQLDLPPAGFVYVYPGIGHAKMGEALGSVPLTAWLTGAGIPVRATQSRFINWEDFRTKNLILLGHDEANQWLDTVLKGLPFRLAPMQEGKPRRIVNVSPRAGERSEYAPHVAQSNTRRPEDYALISMVDGLDDRHRLLLFNGINSEGTQIAEEFLTDPVSVRRLLGKLREAAPRHSGAWHFQIVLHTEVRGNIPTNVEIVAVRVL
jgi:hypothetical protein